MYIKVSNGSQVVNMDAYALIDKLNIYMNNVEVKDLKDGNNYYTKEEIVNLLEGQYSFEGFITEEQLIEVLDPYVMKFELLYTQTDSSEETPTINDIDWNTAIPVWKEGKFIWQLIKIERTNTIQYSNPVCLNGAKGATGEKGQSITDIKQQWCLNNDGNWDYTLIIPSEYDEVWTRTEITWENPDNITYTEPMQDQVYEKVKELNTRLITAEENMTAAQEEITAIQEGMELLATKEELQELIDFNDTNLLKNGNFYDGTKHWAVLKTGSNVPRVQYIAGYPYNRAIVFQGELTHVQHITQPAKPLINKEGESFTLSCMVQTDDNIDGYDMPLYGLKIEAYYNDGSVEEFFSEVEITDGTWNNLSLTIETNKIVKEFQCYFYVCDTLKTIRVSGMMFTQGKLIVPFKPNFEEAFDNIPKYLSELDNDMSFITEDEVITLIENNNNSNNIDLSNYALLEDIPIKLSELENDMDYLMEIPEEYITENELNNKNYLTEHQNISHLALKSEVPSIEGLATEEFVQQQIEALANKVDKEEGKSLVDDAEIARLAQVDNYDDTELREMFIVDEPQKAVFNNRPYIFACGHPLVVEGKDEEVVITYAVNDTNTEMGEIRVPAEEAKSLVIVGGFGDANINRTRILPATHIHVRNVDIQAVYGGNLFEGIVGESTIIIENSSVKEVIGGGDAGRFIEGRWAVRNNVAKANIKLTDVKSSLVFIGGSGGPSNVAEANIELNGNCEIAWLTAGGSNGFTSKSKVVINDGKYECVQMVNRGLVDEAKLVMNGGHIIRAYFAGEAEDATVTGVVNHVVFELNNGKIEKLARGNSNSIEFNGEIKGHIMDCVVLDGDVSMLEKTEPNNAIEDLQAQIDELKAIIEELKNNQ